MNLLDTEHFDIKVEGNKVFLVGDFGKFGALMYELPLIELLKMLAAKTDNKIDDQLVELVEKALQ